MEVRRELGSCGVGSTVREEWAGGRGAGQTRKERVEVGREPIEGSCGGPRDHICTSKRPAGQLHRGKLTFEKEF